MWLIVLCILWIGVLAFIIKLRANISDIEDNLENVLGINSPLPPVLARPISLCIVYGSPFLITTVLAYTLIFPILPPPAPPLPTPTVGSGVTATLEEIPIEPTDQQSTTPRLGSTITRLKDNGIMVYVPAGSFKMGMEDGNPAEQPVHTVRLDAFWIDRTEVTVAMFQEFAKATDYQTVAEKEGHGIAFVSGNWQPQLTGATWKRPHGPNGRAAIGDHPVTQVSWQDAEKYCLWAGGRLPTEAEWEYAARGPDSNKYPWGNDPPTPNLVNYNRLHFETQLGTTPVGSYPNGKSWVGVVDMAGNVWEWTADWYDGNYYSESPTNNPQGPKNGKHKVRRGGSWAADHTYIYSAHRHDQPNLDPLYRVDDTGFRCAMDAD